MNNNSSQTQTRNAKIQSFLEALRNSQTRTTETLGKDSFSSTSQKKELESRRAESFFQARQQEWSQLYSSKEKQKESRLIEVRDQLKQLSKQVKNLDRNLLKAVESPIAQAGIYQENFLTHLLRTIQIYKLKVQEANSWLETYQKRSLKKGVYWNLAKSRGSSFTQSNERSIATSIG